MKIVPMKDSHMAKIIEIDYMVFEREGPRTISNLKGLRNGDPDGCFVLLEEDVLVGYSFTKTMGQEGFLGPLGLHPSIHGQGWGRKLIKNSLDYLKTQCMVIGLEVRPDMGDNIGLYHKLGFHSTFPTLILELPVKLPNLKTISKMNADENLHDMELYSEMSVDRKKIVFDNIDSWTKHYMGGLTFNMDLEMIDVGGGDIVIISQNNEPVGFLAYYPVVFPQLWGAIKPNDVQKEVLIKALHFYRDINHKEEILVGVNARYNELIDLLIDEGCKVIKSVNRMLLEGFEGEYQKRSHDFVMRVWHA